MLGTCVMTTNRRRLLLASVTTTIVGAVSMLFGTAAGLIAVALQILGFLTAGLATSGVRADTWHCEMPCPRSFGEPQALRDSGAP